MKYFVRRGRGAELVVEVERLDGQRYRVRLDGREWQADFADVDRLGQYAVRLDAESFAASIEERDDQSLRVTIAGRSYALEVQDERERAASALCKTRAGGAETVKAAMPGVVIGVRVKAGDAVAAGQALLVLEAMKMQNEISSDHGGVVQEVLVQSGQTVAAGSPLVRLVPR